MLGHSPEVDDRKCDQGDDTSRCVYSFLCAARLKAHEPAGGGAREGRWRKRIERVPDVNRNGDSAPGDVTGYLD